AKDIAAPHLPRRQFLRQAALVRYLDKQGGLKHIRAGQQAIVDIQLRLHAHGVTESSNAQQFLNAEPESLTIFKNKGQPRADANTAITVEIASQRFKKLPAAAGVFAQGQQIVER